MYVWEQQIPSRDQRSDEYLLGKLHIKQTALSCEINSFTLISLLAPFISVIFTLSTYLQFYY